MDGTVVGVGRQQRQPAKGLVNILNDDEGLADGLVTMDEHGHLLVDWVVLEQQLAPVAQVFLDQLIRHALEPKGHFSTVGEWAAESAQKHNPLRHLLFHLDVILVTLLLLYKASQKLLMCRSNALLLLQEGSSSSL